MRPLAALAAALAFAVVAADAGGPLAGWAVVPLAAAALVAGAWIGGWFSLCVLAAIAECLMALGLMRRLDDGCGKNITPRKNVR